MIVKKTVIYLLFFSLFSCKYLTLKNRALDIQGCFLTKDLKSSSFYIQDIDGIWANAYIRIDMIPENLNSLKDEKLKGEYKLFIVNLRQCKENKKNFLLEEGDFNADLIKKEISFSSNGLKDGADDIIQKDISGTYSYNSSGYELGENFSIYFLKHPFFKSSLTNNFNRYKSYE